MNQKQWLLMAAIAAALIMASKGDSMKPRGIRNNNPGNIEDTGTKWRGRLGNDGRFIIFDSPVNGIRAMYKVLTTYRNKYDGVAGVGGKGYDTISEIINRWAPPHENDTGAYIAHAEKALDTPRNMPLTSDKYAALIKVIIKHENGLQPYDDGVINAGIAAA